MNCCVCCVLPTGGGILDIAAGMMDSVVALSRVRVTQRFQVLKKIKSVFSSDSRCASELCLQSGFGFRG